MYRYGVNTHGDLTDIRTIVYIQYCCHGHVWLCIVNIISLKTARFKHVYIGNGTLDLSRVTAVILDNTPIIYHTLPVSDVQHVGYYQQTVGGIITKNMESCYEWK